MAEGNHANSGGPRSDDDDGGGGHGFRRSIVLPQILLHTTMCLPKFQVPQPADVNAELQLSQNL
jgi:hypothetical protein